MEPTGTQSQVAYLQADADRLVTVALFELPHEAHLARLRLEAEGLRCVLQGEYMSGLAWPPAAGVRLCVPAWQAESARQVLADCQPRKSSADFVSADLDAPRCPRCGSLRIRVAPPPGRVRSALGLALPLLRRRAGCRHCRHRWAPA